MACEKCTCPANNHDKIMTGLRLMDDAVRCFMDVVEDDCSMTELGLLAHNLESAVSSLVIMGETILIKGE